MGHGSETDRVVIQPSYMLLVLQSFINLHSLLSTIGRNGEGFCLRRSIAPPDRCCIAGVNTYKITHTTGTLKWDAGNQLQGYLFTLTGTEGSTAEHPCPANRKLGQTGSCTIRDTARIGELKKLKIRSIVDDVWALVNLDVEIDGVLGAWQYQDRGYLGKKNTMTLDLQHTSTHLNPPKNLYFHHNKERVFVRSL